MSDRTYAKVQAQQKTLSGSSAKSSLLQRTCACGQHTIAGGECDACRSKQSTLLRSQRTLESPSAPHAVPGSSPVQEHAPSSNAAFDSASRFGHDFSRIPVHAPAAGVIQTKLAINQPGDHYEQEADRIADQVMRMPEPQLQRACACGGGCPKCQTEQPGQEHERLQTKHVGSSNSGQAAAPPIVHEVLRSPGQPLDPATRAVMEPRFGHDFSRVRIHTSTQAAKSAQELNAQAYTYGKDIVFGTGQYRPMSTNGQQLLSHELTHVIQQSGESPPRQLQRQIGMQQPDIPTSAVKRDAPKAKTWTGAPAACGPFFCQPLTSEGIAIDDRSASWPLFMAAIAYAVSPRVVPLWTTWAFGGSSLMNLTKDFGSDFTASPTTADTTKFLLDKIKAKLTASPPTIPPAGLLKLDIPTLIPAAVKAIDDPSSPNQMNFDVIGDIPGNLAGGIGKDQAATPIGATPSPQNDERIAKGDVTVVDAGATLMALPNLSYTVNDTIDLCPGNCGSSKEQFATISMSQWEATGISGDVPFTVDFPSPPLHRLPFIIPKPAAPATPPSVPAPAPKKPP